MKMQHKPASATSHGSTSQVSTSQGSTTHGYVECYVCGILLEGRIGHSREAIVTEHYCTAHHMLSSDVANASAHFFQVGKLKAVHQAVLSAREMGTPMQIFLLSERCIAFFFYHRTGNQ